MLPPPFTPEFLSRLECLRLRTRKEFLGSRPGSYASPRRGTSLEFADYRRYSPGDDIRYLDWGILARTDRLYIKLFREEVDLFVYLFVDASGSMAFPSVAEKFSRASSIALALAYVVLANHDHVKLHLLGARHPATPFFRGRHRIIELIDFLSKVSPTGPLELAPALGEHLRKLRRPGKAILISDFLTPAVSYQRGLNLLRAFNLDISVIQILCREEIDPPFPQGSLAVTDCESGVVARLQWNRPLSAEYRQRLERHNRELRSFCHQAGIRYSVFFTDRELSGFVLETLPAIGLFK